jgi:SPP1 family predicted phage head-tail adaptor
MRAGKLRHRLQVQSYVEVQSASGEQAKKWETVATVWGSVEPLNGRELFAAQQVQAEVTHTIRLRHVSLDPAQRILFGTRIFNLSSIMNKEERRVELSIMAMEQVG